MVEKAHLLHGDVVQQQSTIVVPVDPGAYVLVNVTGKLLTHVIYVQSHLMDGGRVWGMDGWVNKWKGG